MAPGATFQSTDGGALAMATGPNFPRQDGASAAADTAPTVSPAIVGAGVAAGVVILAIIVGVVIRIQVVRKRHQRAMLELERGLAHSPSRQMEQLARPVSAARCGTFRPVHGQAGWDALYSNDTVNEPERVARPSSRGRPSIALPKSFRQSQKIRLRAWKHLSAIMESPRVESRESPPPSPDAIATADRLMGSPRSIIGQAQTADHAIESLDISDSRNRESGSPKLNVLPSFAIRSPSRCGAAIANDQDRPMKTIRSVTTGVLDTDGAVFGNADRFIDNPKRRQDRPQMHTRSVSLGAPTSRPPSGPVPPLPVISPQAFSFDESVRQGVCITRESSETSINSAGSSVLVTSPILTRKGSDQPAASPTVEQMVAEDDRAELKSVLNRQWQNPNITGPRPNVSLTNMKHQRVRSSVKGSIHRYDSESALSHRLSISSTSSNGSRAENRLSIPQIATADRISISRVSSTNSLVDGSAGRIQKIETPPRRRSHRVSSVSASGSPAARDKRRSSALRDTSSNITGPIKRPSPRRQMSILTQGSACSSNGNPFQWDTNSLNTLPKPSALKGSPNARKNHRRYNNCVRISTLTPEVFGGGRSRSSSPPEIVMDNILEERESEEIKREGKKERKAVERVVAHERRRSRPPMPPRNVSSESCLRIQTLRASLTPSSPTLSAWNLYDQHGHNAGGLSSHPSDSNLSVSPLRSRNSSRMSNRSSGNFVIPKFQSPSKARASIAITVPEPDTAPMPQFSTDVDIESPTLGFHDTFSSSSPFGLAVSSGDERAPVSPDDSGNGDSPVEFSPVSPIDIPSSPPLPISKEKEYDPGWLPVVVDLPTSSEEYDPASPPLTWNGFNTDVTDGERSSGIWLPFAIKEEDQNVSPKSRPVSRAAPADDSPPLSPKTIPTSIPDISVKKSQEKLTSENACSMMAKVPQSTSTSSFLGTSVPVLAPPTQDPSCSLLQWQLQQRRSVTSPSPTGHRRQRSVSTVRIPRPTTATAPDLPTIPQSSSPPTQQSSLAPELLTLGEKLRSSTVEGYKALEKPAPQGPRSVPANSVLKNAMALRRMNSEIQTHRESRESRNFVRLGREPSPLLPWIGTETEDVEPDGGDNGFAFDFDTQAGAESSSSDSSPAGSFFSRPRVHGVPQVQPPEPERTTSALDEVSFETLSKVIEGAPAGFDAEHRASHPKSSAYTYGQGYNTDFTSPLEQHRKGDSNVWDDGEKFWSSSGMFRPESLDVTPTRREQEVEDLPQTVDPRLLSTPAGSITATPRSLYDWQGFLKV